MRSWSGWFATPDRRSGTWPRSPSPHWPSAAGSEVMTPDLIDALVTRRTVHTLGLIAAHADGRAGDAVTARLLKKLHRKRSGSATDREDIPLSVTFLISHPACAGLLLEVGTALARKWRVLDRDERQWLERHWPGLALVALAVVLDQLSPAERATFLLHNVFGISYERIAEFVGRTSSACRQLASRARRSIRDNEPSPPRTAPNPGLQAVVESFIAACSGGDVEALARTLHTDVSGWATVDGRRVRGGHRRLRRAAVVLPRSPFWLSLSRCRWTTAWQSWPPGAGEPVAMVRLDIPDDHIRSMHAVLLPA